MKVITEVFLAIVPIGKIQRAATATKGWLKEQFKISSTALKSSRFISTLKMPFSYNEAKEKLLVEKLENFLSTKKNLKNQGFGGTWQFGKRSHLLEVASRLPVSWTSVVDLKNLFVKEELNLVDELSDRNYHPHMTILHLKMWRTDFDQSQKLLSKSSFLI